ncbi:pyridoxal phosphate-dependent transferase [Gymnopilus junonius]|uniref:Pyridoxal phosphate-dependent transferase n=1 Tax=Gymnopilus junonius TaxID=109634 RepID=A0A9P5NIU9_GYMJU|nr:pyridoxal phosphate-dependent transferase [Gymnopilus junonius]
MMSRKATSERGYSSLNTAHERICALFLGPRAENHAILRDKFAEIVQETLEARERFFPDDPVFIDRQITESTAFSEQVQKFDSYLSVLNGLLAKHCIPFFSPRYNGHMTSDPLMPAILGYLVGLLWNQNNVTPEASPITSYVEYLVGQQLCQLVGYRSFYDSGPTVGLSLPVGWGHITCDGSIANLESLWVVRNLKFYPLSLQRAVKEGRLKFADGLETTLCSGVKKKFVDCSAWELLNLTVDEILSLPTRLIADYGISTRFIENSVKDYLIANTGKDALEKHFDIKSPQVLISVANHYSWLKSTSITGIGIDNLIHIDVDISVCMDMASLNTHLEKCLKDQQTVYCVVAIMGTTEHGAVDPLFDILRLRANFQKRGLSFYVHADAAWGGYFCSMVVRTTPKILPFINQYSFLLTQPTPPKVIIPAHSIALPHSDIVLEQPLSEYSQNQLFSIRHADSTTIDPHKAGFIPYPAGSLCYRDERLRFMVTVTASYINTTADVDCVGTYGVEGSKPGAAATAVWLAHHSVGLDSKGYGSLLGEVMYTSVKLYANWATMSFNDPNLIVKTLAMLPSEKKGLAQSEIDKEIKYIIDKIVNQPNDEIIHGKEIMKSISELGGDLIITVFACNFRINGRVNEDIKEANLLNRRLFERFSVTKREDDPYKCDLFVSSTTLEQKTYGVALDKFKERLGLKGDGDLIVLNLVPMSPFPTAHNLVKSFSDTFKKAAIEEIEECCARIVPSPAQHSFVMQGTDRLFLSYISVFNIGNYRQQVVLTGDLSDEVMKTYVQEAEGHPSTLFTLTMEKSLFLTIISNGSCRVSVYKGLDTKHPYCLAKEVELSNIRVIVNRSIGPSHLDSSYPAFMHFYLYGTTSQQHLDHMLLRTPNTQFAAGRVILDLDEHISLMARDGLLSGLIAVADNVYEEAMQPFNADHEPTFFKSGRIFRISIYEDPNAPDKPGPGLLNDLGSPIVTGTATLSSSIYIDYTLVNQEHGVAISTQHSKAG